MKLLFVTSREAKVDWAQARLKEFGIELVQKPFEFTEAQSTDVVDIAREKARQASKKIRRPLIVTDDGFYIPSLKGFPAHDTKFISATIGAQGILKLMKGLKGKERRAYFKSALAYFDGRKIRVFVGYYRGSIATKLRGRNTRGWSNMLRIWVPHATGKTPAELTKEEYNRDAIEREETGPYLKFARWLKASGRI